MPHGEQITDTDHPLGKDSEIQPTNRPTEYRCFIEEVNPIWRSGCGYLIADGSPSSVTQLPILTALHARFLLCSPLLYTKYQKM